RGAHRRPPSTHGAPPTAHPPPTPDRPARPPRTPGRPPPRRTPMTNETARALLHRHGLPEDIIDGALCLHAQELAAVQRLRMEELDLTGQKARIVGRIVDLIDPARTPAAAPAVVEPAAGQTAPSHQIGRRSRR